MYHDGNRTLQDRFDSRRIADRLVEILHRTAFNEEDRAFIESRSMFFLATADAGGAPDCSYKGGRPGFVRVVGPDVAGLPELRRQRHVQEPGQCAREPKGGIAVHRFRAAPATAGQWRGGDHHGRSAHRVVRRMAARGARPGRACLPELPTLHPSPCDAGIVGLRARAGPRAAGAGLEADGRVSRFPAAATARRPVSGLDRPVITWRREHA